MAEMEAEAKWLAALFNVDEQPTHFTTTGQEEPVH